MISSSIDWRLWRTLLVVLASATLLAAGCDCGPQGTRGIKIQPLIVAPTTAQQLSARAPVEIGFTDDSNMEEVRLVEVFLTPQGSSQSTRIAELYKEPFKFKWNSFQARDGFYKLHAVAYSSRGDDYATKTILVQVVNSPPDIWFVNCADKQFIRGEYSIVVSLNQSAAELEGPPSMLINGQEGPKTVDTRPPYRFPIDTTAYNEGDTIEVVVQGKDVRGNLKRIVCTPQIDNTPPTVAFTRPAKDGLLLGRQFDVEFDAQDRFGVKEVHLWVDGSNCPAPASGSSSGECKAEERWIGTAGPRYPIKVVLPKGYQTEQAILLTARAVDNAGNVSEPARLRVNIDPLEPEIFIREPGQGEVHNDQVKFSARITDNQRLDKVIFRVEGGKKTETLLTRDRRTLSSEITLSYEEAAAISRFGLGKRTFVVEAHDFSGNVTIAKREFLIGCGDSTDCPLGQVCHNSVCTVPAGLNQPCDANVPCAIGTLCIESASPFCSPNKRKYCRKRCNPGNKFVQPQPCGQGYFCSKDTQVCLPADGCNPTTNQGCQSNEQCVLVDDDAGICYPNGNVKDGDVCDETCGGQKNCRGGSWCVYLLDIGRTSCMKTCTVGQASSCPAGQRCYPLRWSFGGGALKIGVCGR